MKKAFIFLIIILSGKFSSGQTDFSNCYDTLFKHLVNDTVSNEKIISNWQNCIKGKQMPFFSAAAFSGKMIDTKTMKGKVLVINLWFTACPPCIAEMPALNRLVKEYEGKDVVFIGLCIDSKKSLGSDFFPKHKFDFIIVPDAMKIILKIGQTGYPTTYIVDKNGNVETAWIGGFVDKTAETAAYLKAKPIIDELLKAEQ